MVFNFMVFNFNQDVVVTLEERVTTVLNLNRDVTRNEVHYNFKKVICVNAVS